MVSTFSDIVNNLAAIVHALVIFLIACSIAYFLYGIAQYILKYGDQGARAQSITIMIHGLIAIFVMLAVWGLTELVLGIIGERLTLPQIVGYVEDVCTTYLRDSIS